jgi:5-oxopent-3-ene-1,2,5-tricarboxylate decarboxylase/2-hydroxyhepta-2,4-diene-1,7-dioate isomerase
VESTVADWDVDLSGPSEQLETSANTRHVALAIPEEEAERLVAERSATR